MCLKQGVRNKLIHEYWGTSIQMIYEISVDEMDELLDYIKQIRELEKSQIS
ncbi:HepT-like ribonuclease domain-containing protein [Cetobacterium sp.]